MVVLHGTQRSPVPNTGTIATSIYRFYPIFTNIMLVIKYRARLG